MNIKFTYILTFLIIILGISLSYFKFFNDYLWLARSGALIVVVGILFAIAEYHNREYQSNMFKFYTSTLKTKILHDNKNIDQDEFNSWVKNTKAEEDKLKSELEKDTLKHEAILLVLGTLIWGFGDVLIKLLFGF
jgi:hypothetical protein